MQRDQVIDLLRSAAASGDDWYSLDETADGLFQVTDGSGAAVVAVEQHWAEVRAARNLSHVSQPLPSLTSGSLLRTVVQPGDPPALLLRGRCISMVSRSTPCIAPSAMRGSGLLPAAEEHRPAPSNSTALASRSRSRPRR
jgi:hypothetical protein